MKASTSISPFDDIEKVAYVDEGTTKVEVVSAIGGKCSNKVDKMEKIYVVSHIEEGPALREIKIDVACGSHTSVKEAAGIDSDAGVGGGNLYQKRDKLKI